MNLQGGIPLRLRRPLAAILFGALLPSGTTHAQPVVRWAKTAGGQQNDSVRDMALSTSGVLHPVGSFDMVNSSKSEVVFYRFDSAGALMDSRASRGEEIRGVAVDAAGVYYLTGRV